MARWFDATRGRALSIAGLGFAAGQAVLPVAFVWLLLAMDWRGLWIVSAVVCALAIPLLLWLLQAERTPQSHARSVQAAGMGGRHWDRRAVLRHGLFWFMVPALLGPAAFNTAFFFQQVPFAEAKGWPLIGLVALFPVYTAMSVAAMLASGWLLDRFGTARLIPWYQLPMVAGFLVFALGDSLAWATVGLLFLALTQGGNATLPPAFWAEFYGTRHLGAIKAMAAAIMVFGTALGPGLTGALIDAGLGIESQYIYVAGYFVFATAMMAIGVGRVLRSTPVTAGQP
jgi:MFS family permease